MVRRAKFCIRNARRRRQNRMELVVIGEPIKILLI